MTVFSRRRFLATATAPLALAACGNGIGGNGGDRIDGRVDAAFNFMYNEHPETRTLGEKATGILMMPVVTEAGFGVGGSYGRGALRVNGATVEYYSTTAASVGFQIGGQQYSHALFFMTQPALGNFRTSQGWTAGADLEYVVQSNAGSLSTDTTALLTPVIAVVFGQAGLLAGASLEGAKYNRIIP